MALWNEKDSRWDNVPDADLTFSDYVTKLLRQPSTFARPTFGGPFASTSEPAPVADQTKMEGMFEEYLRKKQQPTSSFKQQESSNPKWDAMTDAEKAAWYAENPRMASFTRALQDIWTGGGAGAVNPILGMFAKAQNAYYPEFVDRQRLIAQGIDPDSVVPRDAASASYRYAGISPYTVEANREVASLLGRYPAPAVAPVAPEPQGEPVAQSFPVSSSYYATNNGTNITPEQVQAAVAVANEYKPQYTADPDGGYSFD